MLSYIINWEELLKKLNLDMPDLSQLEEALKNRLDEIIDLLKQLLAKDKEFNSVGLNAWIPALTGYHFIEHTFEHDVLLTGITYSQTAWKYQDNWSLEVGGVLLFDGIYTKEAGQSKELNTFYHIPQNTPIKIIYNNQSGNSKRVWYDLNYIKYPFK